MILSVMGGKGVCVWGRGGGDLGVCFEGVFFLCCFGSLGLYLTFISRLFGVFIFSEEGGRCALSGHVMHCV